MEFIRNHIELLFGIIVVTVFLLRAAMALKKAHKIDREGRETDAVVSRIEEQLDTEQSVTYLTYVQYHDEKGELREDLLSSEAFIRHEKGEKIRIRYLPGEHELVREVTDI